MKVGLLMEAAQTQQKAVDAVLQRLTDHLGGLTRSSARNASRLQPGISGFGDCERDSRGRAASDSMRGGEAHSFMGRRGHHGERGRSLPGELTVLPSRSEGRKASGTAQ